MNQITKKDATDVVAHDVHEVKLDTDPAKFSRLGWIIVLVGFVGFLAWAMLAPLDKGVPLSGTVAKESNRQLVQTLSGGTIQDILVKNGDVVQQGQVLVRMNATQVKGQADETRSRYFSARAAESRLIAERDGLKSVRFPAELEKAKSDPRVIEAVELQKQLFSSRLASLSSELAVLDESIAGTKAQLAGVREASESRRQQMVFMKEQLAGMRDLAKDGYVARNRLLELERGQQQLAAAMAEDAGQIGRLQRQVSELGLRRLQRQQEYQKDLRSQLADVQREAEALQGRMSAIEFEEASVDVKAPMAGVVTNLKVHTKGGVVGQGYQLMEIVPSGGGLVVDGQLSVTLIDKVHVGLPVEVMFPAFNAATTPHIPAKIVAVAADRVVEERTGMPYYAVQVKVTPEGEKLIAKHKLAIQPGMPADLFVKTGERTMMNYLFKPLADRAKTALSED